MMSEKPNRGSFSACFLLYVWADLWNCCIWQMRIKCCWQRFQEHLKIYWKFSVTDGAWGQTVDTFDWNPSSFNFSCVPDALMGVESVPWTRPTISLSVSLLCFAFGVRPPLHAYRISDRFQAKSTVCQPQQVTTAMHTRLEISVMFQFHCRQAFNSSSWFTLRLVVIPGVCLEGWNHEGSNFSKFQPSLESATWGSDTRTGRSTWTARLSPFTEQCDEVTCFQSRCWGVRVGDKNQVVGSDDDIAYLTENVCCRVHVSSGEAQLSLDQQVTANIARAQPVGAGRSWPCRYPTPADLLFQGSLVRAPWRYGSAQAARHEWVF